MTTLDVPYVAQLHPNSCGAAALEMVYRFFGLKGISQVDIFEANKTLEPHGSGNYIITTDKLVQDAKNRGFGSVILRIDYRSQSGLAPLIEILGQGIPVIVCQQFTKSLPLIGHFRVVTGMDVDWVYFHDPSPEIGGKSLRQSHREFLEYWQPTGLNVTGGIFFVVYKLS